MKAQHNEEARAPAVAAERALSTAAQVCTTVVDELLEAQLDRGQVCTTAVDELLEAQLDRGQVCTTVVDELLEAQLEAGRP